MFYHAVIFAKSGGGCLNMRLLAEYSNNILPMDRDCSCNEKQCDHYACIFYLIPTKVALKKDATTPNYPFSYAGFL